MNYNLEINRLRKEKNIIILAHYYQRPEIQEIADFTGDSLALSQKAASTDAKIIVFAGVHFMAETAKILCPDQKVLIPDLEAGCSLADSCPPDKFNEFINNNSGHTVISYINCSAQIKGLSDIICTSSNAISIVEKLNKDKKIIFAPDRNLGKYVNDKTGRNMLLWDGYCSVHEALSLENIVNLKSNFPDAILLAHPECKTPVLEIADFIGSTKAMLDFTQKDTSDRYIVATETGIIHQMKKNSPNKEFLSVISNETCSCSECNFMRLNTIEKLYLCMKNEKPEIILDKELMDKARKPILRMLEMS